MLRERNWLKHQTLTRVVVHTDDGRSLDGVLATVAKDGIVLDHAKLLDGEQSHSLGGHVWLERERIAFVQVMAP